MWLKNFLKNFRLRSLERHQRRLEKRRTQNLLRQWRTETRRDRLRLWFLLFPLQLLSRYSAATVAEENDWTDSNPDRPKPLPPTAKRKTIASEGSASRWLLQLLHRFLLQPLRRLRVRLFRRLLVRCISLLLRLVAWRLSRCP